MKKKVHNKIFQHLEFRKPLGYLLARLYWRRCRYFDQELKSLGIGHGSLPFLMTIWEECSITQNELSFFLETDKANTARAVSKLVDIGYVQRMRNPDDLRVNIVKLTEQGLNIMPKIENVINSWNAILTSNMNEEEFKTVYSLLTDMNVNVCDNFNNNICETQL